MPEKLKIPDFLPIHIPVVRGMISGDLLFPEHADGLVLFIRAEGMYRDYPHDRRVAKIFAKHRLATLILDISLSPQHGAPDLSCMDKILREVILWAHQDSRMKNLPLACFGVGIGAASALTAAAGSGKAVQVVVSCDGRPDLVPDILPKLTVPVLLVTGCDPGTLAHNQRALNKIKSLSSMNVIRHTAFVFENNRALDEAAQISALWLAGHLQKPETVEARCPL